MKMREAGKRVLADVQNYYRGALLAAVYVGATGALDFPVCPMVRLTGLPCPGCGMTRAAALFLQGRWLRAWQMHPFFYALLLLAIVAAVFRYGMGRAAPRMRALVSATLILAVGFYAYRMARYFPEQEPMVYFEGNALRFVAQLVAHLRRIC